MVILYLILQYINICFSKFTAVGYGYKGHRNIFLSLPEFFFSPTVWAGVFSSIMWEKCFNLLFIFDVVFSVTMNQVITLNLCYPKLL